MKKQTDYFPEYLKINGMEQYLLHHTTNTELPVLLFLHGGPGMSESTFAYAFQEELSGMFTIVHWDQRGSGKTLTRAKGNGSYPTGEELMDDLYQIVIYLKKRYDKEKIIILGHSWGSVLGTLFVMKYPQEVLFYIGAGQVVDIVENEKVGYEKVRELIIKADNKKDLDSLEKIGVYPEKEYRKSMIKKIQRIRILQGKYKVGMNFIPILKTLLKSPHFRLSDISSLLKGMNHNTKIWEYLFSHSLYKESRDYEIPVFYILGDRDFQAPNTIASRYFDSILAPYKKMFIIEDAGHFMMLDQPKLFADTMAEIAVCEKYQTDQGCTSSSDVEFLFPANPVGFHSILP